MYMMPMIISTMEHATSVWSFVILIVGSFIEEHVKLLINLALVIYKVKA